MNRRQALIALGVVLPVAAHAQQVKQQSLDWSVDSNSQPLISLSFTNRTVTIYGLKRSVTVTLDEIVEALDPEKP